MELKQFPIEEVNPHIFCAKGKAEAFALITTALGDEKNVFEEISKIDALNEAYIVHGPYDIIAKFKTKTYECLKEILNIRIREIKGIKRTRNLIIA